MPVDNAKEFFERLESDEDFKDDFMKEEILVNGELKTILKAAAKRGYEFTQKDLDEAIEELNK